MPRARRRLVASTQLVPDLWLEAITVEGEPVIVEGDEEWFTWEVVCWSWDETPLCGCSAPMNVYGTVLEVIDWMEHYLRRHRAATQAEED